MFLSWLAKVRFVLISFFVWKKLSEELDLKKKKEKTTQKQTKTTATTTTTKTTTTTNIIKKKVVVIFGVVAPRAFKRVPTDKESNKQKQNK